LNFDVKIDDEKKKDYLENDFGYNVLANGTDDRPFYRIFVVSD
jgi:hypothetical protein